MKERYPKLEINLGHLHHNMAKIVEMCGSHGIQVAAVIKGVNGLPEVAKTFDHAGAAFIASSRLEQLQDAKDAGIEKKMMLIRIPMLSEVRDVVEIADISLNSELEVIKALNAAARDAGKLHKVILMADVGDLREGWWDKDELVDVAEYIENKLINIQLVGVGFNVGCYGSTLPTVEKLEELVAVAERIEERIGRELEYISGGATSTLLRVIDGNVPKRINLLRIGEGALQARDLDVFYGYDMSEFHQDTFSLKAEVIEVKTKPSYPVGEIGVDAFGHCPVYIDRGMRKRALVGMGKVDYGDPGELLVEEEGIEIIGAASDHTIIDIEDAAKDWKVGDIMTFGVCYATAVYLTSSKNVVIEYV